MKQLTNFTMYGKILPFQILITAFNVFCIARVFDTVVL